MGYPEYPNSVFGDGEIDSFPRMSDIQASEIPTMNQFKNYIVQGDVASAQALLEANPSLKDKIFDASKFNNLRDAILSVQKMFNLNVAGFISEKQQEMNTYIDNKQTEIQVEVDKIQYKGEHDLITQYYSKNIVDYDDGTGIKAYLCIKDNKGILPTDITCWKPLTIKGSRGEKGQDGVNLVFKGAWVSTTSYVKDEAVQFGGFLMSCQTSNVGIMPDVNEDNEYWAKVLKVSTVVTELVGVRTIASDSTNINFITGEINAFNPNTDTIAVYQDKDRLTRNVHYKVNNDNQSIDKLEGGVWSAGTMFEFSVKRNQRNNLVFSDGQTIQLGTIDRTRLTTDVQADLDKIPILNTKVSPETPLNTTSQNLSGAINELYGKAGKIGTKEIDETQLKDDEFYKLEYETSKGKWVVKPNIRPKIYGVKIDKANSNPETAVAYIKDSVGFTPMKGNDGVHTYGSWQDKFPFNQIKPCIVQNGVVSYYLNPNDYTKKSDGTTADITTGTDGDVMVEIPKIYWKIYQDDKYTYVQYSDKQVDSSWKCLAHQKGNKELDKCYIGAYLGYEQTGKLRSLSGKIPTASKNIGQFRTLAQANGMGYEQMAYYQYLMLQVLYTVAFKNLDSQTALGRGCVDGNASATTTGGTNAKGMFYGETTGKQQNKFCGIEDFYGNLRYFVDGFFCDSDWNILIANDNFNSTGDGYTNCGQGATANTAGYINGIQGGTETGFVIKEKAGSSTTFYSDYGGLYAARLPVVGASWDNGSNGGAFYFYCNYSATSANSYVGSRLLACV